MRSAASAGMKLTIPHWVMALLGLYLTIEPQLAHAFPAEDSIFAMVGQVDSVVLTVLGVITGSALTGKVRPPAGLAAFLLLVGVGYSVPGRPEALHAYRANMRPMPARVAVAWRSVVVRGVLAATMVLGLISAACTGAQVVAVAPAVANVGACIITTAAADQQRGLSAIATVEDVIAKCGADAASIATILDAETKAQVVGTNGDSSKLPAYLGGLQSVAVAAHTMSALDAGAGK
jgi:hypothetical protein